MKPYPKALWSFEKGFNLKVFTESQIDSCINESDSLRRYMKNCLDCVQAPLSVICCYLAYLVHIN